MRPSGPKGYMARRAPTGRSVRGRAVATANRVRDDMTRIRFAACALVVLSSLMPASAGGSERGRVMFATGHPATARQAVEWSRGMNGVFGWVFRLAPHADDAPYELTVKNGLTGVENADVYFYTDGGNRPGDPCLVSPTVEERRSETGYICPGPDVGGWGVVVLVAGANAQFSIDY